MKKVLIVLLAVTVLLACDKDKETKPSIIGIWKQERMLYNDAITDSLIYETIPDSCSEQSTWEYTQNNKLICNIYFKDLEQGCLQMQSRLNYKYNEETTRLIISGVETEIITLTENKLIISEKISDINGDQKEDKAITYFSR